jgi:hypothetical protein
MRVAEAPIAVEVPAQSRPPRSAGARASGAESHPQRQPAVGARRAQRRHRRGAGELDPAQLAVEQVDVVEPAGAKLEVDRPRAADQEGLDLSRIG